MTGLAQKEWICEPRRAWGGEGMSDNLTKQVSTMIETITMQSSATPIEKSVIGLLSDCRHAIDLANTEIERLREALADIANIINPYEDGDTMQEIARAALGKGKE
jgi:hypothetical protein